MKKIQMPTKWWNDKFLWNPITGLREYNVNPKPSTKKERVLIPLE